MQRIFIIVGIISALAGLAVGIYFFFFAPEEPSNNPTVFDPFGNVVSDPRDTSDVESPGFVIDGQPRQGREKITQIHPDPVAGTAFFSQEIEVGTTTTINSREVYFVEKQTGNVFAYSVDTGEVDRISNTTFPGVQHVYWSSNPENVVLEYVNDDRVQEIYSAEIVSGELTGSFLPRELTYALPFGEAQLLTATLDARGTSFGLTDTEGNGEVPVFETALQEIQIAQAGESTFVFFSTPASQLEGGVYEVNVNTGTFTRLLGGLNGLTALPDTSGTYVLYSNAIQGGLRTGVLIRETGLVRPLPLITLPEKCVWDELIAYCMVPQTIPEGNYPEHWYQGKVQFTDALWRIDVSNGSARAVSFFDEEGPMDGVKLEVSNEGDYLTFINKRDGSLWGIEL